MKKYGLVFVTLSMLLFLPNFARAEDPESVSCETATDEDSCLEIENCIWDEETCKVGDLLEDDEGLVAGITSLEYEGVQCQ